MTMTTVGYGDATPVSEPGQVIACVLSISSALYMAIPLGIVGNAFSHVWEDRDRLLLMSRTRDCLMQVGYTATSIPQLFLMYDSDKDGQLTLAEFRSMLQEMQIGIGEDRIFKLFQTFDADGSGAVDDREFVRELFPKNFAEIYDTPETDRQ
mmetsp:Transcript_119027/g.188514  ORF Transcript_119027/g.188514 Transcript_119027/m.188514 type:complete len:152 (-) Transcript_119027:32-487(-)